MPYMYNLLLLRNVQYWEFLIEFPISQLNLLHGTIFNFSPITTETKKTKQKIIITSIIKCIPVAWRASLFPQLLPVNNRGPYYFSPWAFIRHDEE